MKMKVKIGILALKTFHVILVVTGILGENPNMDIDPPGGRGGLLVQMDVNFDFFYGQVS